ncbi:MAG: hypothetical protein GPJ54_05655 [Candidatus Heimdallarchaeota archaeon]|nr:hypothetical protein [Candidatus Heimdallarchaeota archaeon]
MLLLVFSILFTSSIKYVHSQETDEEQVFIFRQWVPFDTSATPLTWNYNSGFIGNYWSMLNDIGASLYQKYAPDSGPDHDFITQLAAELPVISDDGLTYTVTLKEGLKFSNGHKLTSEDVVFSYNLYLTPAISQQRYFPIIDTIGSNSSISALDALTIQFEYLEDSVYNFEILSGYPIFESTETYRNKYNNCVEGMVNDCIFTFSGDDVFTGAGPFMIDSFDFDNHEFQLVKNPFYHDNEVWADRIILQGNWGGNFDVGFNATEVAEDEVADLIGIPFNPALLDEWEKPHPYVLHKWPHAQVLQIVLNFQHTIFGSGVDIPFGVDAVSDNDVIQARYVRTALSYLMDRDYMSNEVWGRAGIPTNSLIPRTAVGYNESQEVYQFSLESAKLNLERAGFDYSDITDANGDGDYADENDTRFFDFTLNNLFDRPDRAQYIEYVAPLFAKVGIGLNTQPDNPGQHIWWGNKTLIPTYEEGGFDAVMFVLNHDQPYTMGSLYSSTGLCDVDDPNLRCWNIGGYENPVLDSLISQFDNEGNYAIRTNLLPQIQALMSEDLPAIPIAFGNSPGPRKNDLIMPDAKYSDSNLIRGELIRKEGWIDPRTASEDEAGIDTAQIFVISGGIVAIGAGVFLIQRYKK